MNGEKTAPQQTLPVITLGDEELSDVVLSKFFVYDREATASSRLGLQYARRCGGGCRGCGGAGRCGGGGAHAAAPDAAEAVPMRRRMRRGPPMRRLWRRHRLRRRGLCPLQLQLLPVVGILPAMLAASALE